jgi:hypothetical protein
VTDNDASGMGSAAAMVKGSAVESRDAPKGGSKQAMELDDAYLCLGEASAGGETRRGSSSSSRQGHA